MFFLTLFLSQSIAATIGPTTFPVFLKEGFSSILEFEDPPTQVVLGDQNLFQVERLNRSIVIKPLTTYAITNMFVYFKQKETRLFLLSASEENEPTYYKKFESITPHITATAKPHSATKYSRGIKIKRAAFDKMKDYLTIDFELSADSSGKILPNWDLIRLKYKDRFVSPNKLWSERREVQRDSSIRGRLIFTKPNIPLDLKDTSVIIPVKGSANSIRINLKGSRL